MGMIEMVMPQLIKLAQKNADKVEKPIIEIIDNVELLEGESESAVMLYKSKGVIKVGLVTLDQESKVKRLLDTLPLVDLLIKILNSAVK